MPADASAPIPPAFVHLREHPKAVPVEIPGLLERLAEADFTVARPYFPTSTTPYGRQHHASFVRTRTVPVARRVLACIRYINNLYSHLSYIHCQAQELGAGSR